ncbi:ABC transporter permease [Oryzomonas japonica]|uniref:ABC transporter permease n=1 Tax=Oryzomonas japonica TaxID=2603858 RepID=A0A7J4ZV06_9BACT|nr:ABC transporter permease [Oryzomonas japonica]KAB0666769.1 ABC transporter permease [Oryzomonas japonica]
MFTALGRWAIIRFSIVVDILFTIGRAGKSILVFEGRAAVRSVFLKQIYFTGLEASGIIMTIALILGTVIITQVVSLVGDNGFLTGKILVWVVLRELAPLLTAIVVIARSGTAIAAELGAMKINGEIESLEMMGIPGEHYLIFPRIAGVTISMVILTVYFVLTAFIGSFLIASVGWHIPYEQFIQGILTALGVKEVVVPLLKCVLFGLCTSATCCCFGLSVDRSVTEIPQVATKGVMFSLFVVFFMDALVTYISSL